MEAALYQTILSQGAWVDLSTRAKWRLSGTDRVRYLNGQVTQDVRSATPDKALHACVTNVKGRIEGDIFIHADADSLLFDAPAGLREFLGARLERYIIADDATLEDVTDSWRLWHCIEAAPGTAGGSENGCVRLKNNRLGLQGFDLWIPPGSPAPDLALHQLSAEDAETLRILQGVPAWPQELNTEVFPPEAGLEKTAMSFTKGCYIGQEVLSRIKTTGKMPNVLAMWEAADGDESLLAPGATLSLDREIGKITSVTRHPVSGQRVGLAFIRQGSASLDSKLPVGNGLSSIAAHVKISALSNQ
jgi:folate-binding protein YgfZ